MDYTTTALGQLCDHCLLIFRGSQICPRRIRHIHKVPVPDRSCRLCARLLLECDQLTGKLGLKNYNQDSIHLEYAWNYEEGEASAQTSLPADLLLSFYMRFPSLKTKRVLTCDLVLEVVHDSENLSWKTHLASRTDSESSIMFLDSKLRTCQKLHDKCNNRFDARPGWRPTRLLEIDDTDNNFVYLRDGRVAQSQPYVTLSHCWGSVKPYTLTSETEARMRAGISAEEFPKTFRDALYVAHRLSTRYIWIDSLCIRQDSDDDWQHEAPTMCDVYSQALCNIAATAAVDGSIGLFFERDASLHCPFLVQIESFGPDPNASTSRTYPAGTYSLLKQHAWTDEVEIGPLHNRAWVVQERLLSTRIMYFAKSQVFWECLEEVSSEGFPDVLSDSLRPDWSEDPRALTRLLHQEDKSEEYNDDLYDEWRVVLISYTACRLSRPSDRFAAIMGIGRLFSQVTGDELICGLWKGHLLQELCWGRGGPRRRYSSYDPRDWWAPTWSWASSDAVAWPSNVRHHVTRCTSFQFRAAVEAIDVEEAAPGRLKRALLTLRGKLFVADFKYKRSASITEVVSNGSYLRTDSTISHGIVLILDDTTSELEVSTTLVCLRMFDCGCTEFGDEGDEVDGRVRTIEALALRPPSLGNPHYVRVGKVVAKKVAYCGFYTAHESSREHSVQIT